MAGRCWVYVNVSDVDDITWNKDGESVREVHKEPKCNVVWSSVYPAAGLSLL